MSALERRPDGASAEGPKGSEVASEGSEGSPGGQPVGTVGEQERLSRVEAVAAE